MKIKWFALFCLSSYSHSVLLAREKKNEYYLIYLYSVLVAINFVAKRQIYIEYIREIEKVFFGQKLFSLLVYAMQTCIRPRMFQEFEQKKY